MAEIAVEVKKIAERARAASALLAVKTDEERNAALFAMAKALRDNVEVILSENLKDVDAARQAGTKESLVDRLALNEARLEDMASALEDLAKLDDPVGRVQERREMYNGIQLERVSVPLGVVAVVYEARPNVTADAAGICLKSGNASVLRGGSLAAHSNAVLAYVLHDAAVAAGMPAGCICCVETTDRAATDELMQLHGLIDVLVPRGGAGLIKHCVECSKVPVIETGTGNCHVYVHETADLKMAREIVMNAKCRRYGVCNAAETLLVDESIVEAFLPEMLKQLNDKGVTCHCDEKALAFGEGSLCVYGDEVDWATEYLAPDIAVKCVSGVDEAISHVNAYGTKHSEAIVSSPENDEGVAAAELFLNMVDAAAVYWNASTAFTDGGQFGLGAEIGISTQKLHARGPFATDALTSYKYVLRGNGQVRS